VVGQMKLHVEAINHVGIVVKDKAAAERFYVDILGLPRHHVRPFWLVLNSTSTLHLIHIADAAADARHHSFRHFALQVPDLRVVLHLLLDHNLRAFQCDFHGNEQDVTSRDGPLDFGTGSLFVHDPDGNTIEFLQLGHGIFSASPPPSE
jgi:catechol 2,3-dioxygenase-like lactoylglutathione lyase family enzyme